MPGLAPIAFMITLAATAIAVIHHSSLRSGATSGAAGPEDDRAAESGWILDVLLAAHAAVYVWLTLATREVNRGELSLVPLADVGPTLTAWFTEWIPQHGLTQVPPQVMLVAVNFLLLAPFGAVAPLRWRWLSTGLRVLGAAAAVAVADELLQLLLGRGRVVSFDDVLVQALGACAIYAMTDAALKARDRRLATAREAS
ncbi:VanZ family protein [Myceligenerans crystallogenes]|uniref:VanZ-like domain-containing protein n=1 Tax=Myceligenerans crystallogenes TaxID=316335 RepID=A0ABN2N7D5_9MICO